MKKTVGVFFGSRSTEHDVSIITAISSVIKPLKLSGKYNVVPIYISKNGAWYTGKILEKISTYTTGDIEKYLQKMKPVSLDISDGLQIISGKFGAKKVRIDIAFPATHGTHGEDGELMGIFEMANVAYVGCGVAASSIAMDKVLAKQIALASNLPIAKFISASKVDYGNNVNEWLAKIEKELKYPLFVKPPHLGSSIGITRVSNVTELENAIEVALHYDNTVLVEEAVENLTEVTLPIMGNEQPIPALLEQPLIQAEDFFDFDTKYMQSGKKGKGAKSAKSGSQGYSNLPADLPQNVYSSAEDVGIAMYKALGCKGIARVDMLINMKKQVVYFNEINPLPGGLYAHNWSKAGVSNVELVERLVMYAEESHKEKNRYSTIISTSYLKQF